jgi:hypothetical protein
MLRKHWPRLPPEIIPNEIFSPGNGQLGRLFGAGIRTQCRLLIFNRDCLLGRPGCRACVPWRLVFPCPACPAGMAGGMRPGCSRFRRVCPCRAAPGAAGCFIIAGHRCQIWSPMARNADASPPRIPLTGMGTGNGGTRGAQPGKCETPVLSWQRKVRSKCPPGSACRTYRACRAAARAGSRFVPG